MLAVAIATGFPAHGREPGLAPSWSVLDSGRSHWHTVHSFQGDEGWLLCGKDAVWSVTESGAVRRIVRSRADGGVLRQPASVGVGPRSLLVYDRETMNVVEADRKTGEPIRVTLSLSLGGAPYTGSAWNGRRWILSGYLKGGPSKALLEIQAREPGSWEYVGGSGITPEERGLTGSLLPLGSVAAGPGGKTLVSFLALGRAIVVDDRGEELLSLNLPIDGKRALAPEQVKAPPTTADEYRAVFRGRSVPVGAGWMGDDPCVLIADLAIGEGALRWCRFSSRTGELLSETTLGLPSRDPGDWFYGAASTRGAVTTVAVLARPWNASDQTVARLSGFRISAARARTARR